MTGAEDLFSDPQPVTETWSALSLSGGVAGISPQKGSDETLARTQGKAFPFRTRIEFAHACSRRLGGGAPNMLARRVERTVEEEGEIFGCEAQFLILFADRSPGEDLERHGE